MKILLAGLGSIGKRHLRNIIQLGYDDITVVSRSGTVPDEFASFTVFATIEAALNNAKFDAAIVCTPTALHTQALQTLVAAHVSKIYLEKPVSHALQGLDTIVEQCRVNKIKVIVGYDLHFDLGLQKVKHLLSENVIGKVVSVNAQVGQYLPDWRPHEDYTKGMSARKETGGGVMLDLVHEFDYLLWLFGNAKTVACQYTNTGALRIETEDVCDVLLRFESGVSGSIHLDYLQPTLVRNCLITGYNGSISWNLAASKVTWQTNADKALQEFSYTGYERNQRFIEIIQAFLENQHDERLTSLQQGIESLKMVLAAKQSSEQQRFIIMQELSTFNFQLSTT